MNNHIDLTVRAFPVRYRDERTGAVSDGNIVLTKQQLQAAALVGMDSETLISRIYNRQGYRVLDIGASDKKQVTVDLYILDGEIVAEGAEPLCPTQHGGLQEERRDTEDVNTCGETAD